MEFLYLATSKVLISFKLTIMKRTYNYFLVIVFLFLSSIQLSNAHHVESHGSPVIFSLNPQFIPQGQTTIVEVTGQNLPNIVGIDSDDVYAIILKRNIENTSLTIQLSTRPTSLGPRNLILRSLDGNQATFPFQIVPSGAPIVESIFPSIAYPGDTILVRFYGKNLTSPFITTLSEQVLVISSRPSSDGSIIDLTVSVDPQTSPGNYPIIISTPYGQSEVSFTILDPLNKVLSSDAFNADPYSPGISSVELDSQNRKVILKGSMFDPDPLNNTVTLLENSDGTVTSRLIEVEYADSDEIIIDLPEDLTSDSISFAVSNTDGRSSNIKTIDLNSLTNMIDTTSDQSVANSSAGDNNEPNSQGTEQNIHIDISTHNATGQSTNTTQHDTQQAQSKTEDPVQNELIANKPPEKNSKETTNLPINTANPSEEEVTIIQNFQNISQYLFDSSNKNNERAEATISELKDPKAAISALEETRQLKSQTELIMHALDSAKENPELSNAVRKTEELKAKVEDLEKMLNSEKQKDKPNFRKLAKYEKLLLSANAESKSQTFELLNNLLKYKPQLKNLLVQKPFDLAEIQSNIPLDSVVLQYVPTEEGLIIFVVDRNNLKTRINKNVTKSNLSKEVQLYRDLLEKEIEKISLTGRTTPITTYKPNKTITYKKEIRPLKIKSVLLYNALIKPVEKDILSKKNIAIIANGWLRYLPFQSLAKITNKGEINFLISDKSIVYLDSVLAVSKNPSPQLNSTSQIVVFANPDGSLEGASKEAEIITKLFTKTTRCLVKKPFNIQVINKLAKDADIVHLATHGHLDSTNIENSYLISGKTQDNNFPIEKKLFLKDIYNLNLNKSKLVILSGCDTGKIGNLQGEPDDIVGSLATAFRVAGADSLLASLWKAHDEATKIIMQNFYQNIKLGINKAEALRIAQLKLKEIPKYSHPLFWSLFSLIGDWR